MRLVFLGPPGAGKGTQARELSRSLGVPHISTGDIFREEMAKGSQLGKQIRDVMERGELVSDELTNAIVAERLKQADAARGFILDGYPRSRAQAEALERLPADQGGLHAVLNLAVDDEKIVRRLSRRRSCPTCGLIYNLDSAPPREDSRCDHCQSALLQREDDNEAVIRNRLRVYREKTAELLDYYRERGLLREIDGNLGPVEVQNKVYGLLGIKV